MKLPTQFLTAKFKLRPSRRKASALERVRAAAEMAFWAEMRAIEEAAKQIVDIEKKADRKKRVKALTAPRNLKKYGLPSSICDGVAADLEAAALSYVELRAAGHAAEWAQEPSLPQMRYTEGLDSLAASTDKAAEDLSRDEIYRGTFDVRPRAIRITRGRECRLLRRDDSSPIIAAVTVLEGRDKRSRKAVIDECIDAVTGEAVKAHTSTRTLLIPVECSKWHEMKFLTGNAVLRAAKIDREGDDWYLHAQFEVAAKRHEIEAEAVLGVDRGIVVTAATALVGMDGSVKLIRSPGGSKIKDAIRAHERKNRERQRRKGSQFRGHKLAVDQMLHELANEIVSIAKSGRAVVAVEKLDGFKQTMGTKRSKGARRNVWQKSLRTMQLTKLEQILEYKLKLAGLPPLQYVVAGGTSQTCTCCGHKAKENRTSQAEFKCVECGFLANADTNAAVQIARRGVMQVCKQIKKGAKMDSLHKNMVEGLSARDDGGLGPLAAGAARGLVAVLDSVQSANEEASASLTPDWVKKSVTDRKNLASRQVFAERRDLNSASDTNGLGPDRLLESAN